jgi:hypothetical protein
LTWNEPRLRQAIAVIRRDEVGEPFKAGIRLETRDQGRAGVELAEEFEQGAFAEAIDFPRQVGRGFRVERFAQGRGAVEWLLRRPGIRSLLERPLSAIRGSGPSLVRKCTHAAFRPSASATSDCTYSTMEE